MEAELAPSARLLFVWSLLLSVLGPSLSIAGSENALPTEPSIPTGTNVGGAPGPPTPSPFNLAQANRQGTPNVEGRRAISTHFPQEQRPQLRRPNDVDSGGSHLADPPSLWLNSLDSLRCTNYSTAAPGDVTCEGPEAWRRASDGSEGVFFVALGDTGLLTDGLTWVSDRLNEVCSSLPISFVSLLGDNFYPNGVSDNDDLKFSTNFEVPFNHASMRRVAFFPILGNHDYKSNPQAQIERYYALCPTCKQPQDWNSARVRWRFPNPWYFSRLVYSDVPADLSGSPAVRSTEKMQRRKDAAQSRKNGNFMTVINVHLDSNLLLNSPVHTAKQIAFLEKVLQAAAAEADWVFVHQHHPLFTDATLSRNDRAFQKLLLPVFSRFGVDAVFAGHEHLLSQFDLVDADDDSGPVVQVVSGSGCKLHAWNPKCCNGRLTSDCESGVQPCPSKNCIFQETRYGFALVELSMKQMRLHFIDAVTGEIISRSTYESKKSARLLNARRKFRASDDTTLPEMQLAGVSAYPPITRVFIPRELMHGVLSHSLTWIPVMALIIVALLCIFCYRRCEAFHDFLSKRSLRPNLTCWRRVRHGSFELVGQPTAIGAAQTSGDSGADGIGEGTTAVTVSPGVPAATAGCELRKQRVDEGFSLV